MKAEHFFAKIQNYYGRYPKGQIDLIAIYLKSKGEKYLDVLFDTVIFRYSSKWGRPPDIAIFEEQRKEIIEKLKSIYKNKQIEEHINPIQHEKVKNMLTKLLSKVKT